jgi:hypothetical protein
MDQRESPSITIFWLGMDYRQRHHTIKVVAYGISVVDSSKIRGTLSSKTIHRTINCKEY